MVCVIVRTGWYGHMFVQVLVCCLCLSGTPSVGKSSVPSSCTGYNTAVVTEKEVCLWQVGHPVIPSTGWPVHGSHSPSRLCALSRYRPVTPQHSAPVCHLACLCLNWHSALSGRCHHVAASSSNDLEHHPLCANCMFGVTSQTRDATSICLQAMVCRVRTGAW